MENPEDPRGPEAANGQPAAPKADAHTGEEAQISYEMKTDQDQSWYHDESYTYSSSDSSAVTVQPGAAAPPVPVAAGGSGNHPPPPPKDEDEDEEDEDGMLRMSFLGHLEELRTRIFYALIGFGVAGGISLAFCKQLWNLISAPAVGALTNLGIKPATLSQLTPMEGFNVIYVKVPVLTSIFLSSPWLIYQVWAFISPGLYKRERRWAVPFVLCTAGLFITGGLFAYFVAFKFGLEFLLGVGRDVHVTPLVSINEYFDLFVNVTLGIGLVFELPVLIFFLTLLRIVTPKFLLNHSRYAILAIFIIAAVVTPTPDIFNLMLFATPMCLLFYVGLFASYLLELNRAGRKFPWARVLWIVVGVLVLLAGVVYLAIAKFGLKFLLHWPFLAR